MTATTSNQVPEKYSEVAYWNDRRTTRGELVWGRNWAQVQHYVLLNPTGPRKVSYFAKKLAVWFGGKSQNVRVKLEDPNQGTLVSEKEYRRLHAEAFLKLEQQEMWDALSR